MKMELGNSFGLERKKDDHLVVSAPPTTQNDEDLAGTSDLILEAEQFLAAVVKDATKTATVVADVSIDDTDITPPEQAQSGEPQTESDSGSVVESSSTKSSDSFDEKMDVDSAIADEQNALSRIQKRDKAMETLDIILGSKASKTPPAEVRIEAVKDEVSSGISANEALSETKKEEGDQTNVGSDRSTGRVPTSAAEGLSKLASRKDWKEASDIESILELCFSESLLQKRKSHEDKTTQDSEPSKEAQHDNEGDPQWKPSNDFVEETDSLESSSQLATLAPDVEHGSISVKDVPYQGWPKKNVEENLVKDYESYTEEMEEFHPLPKLVVKEETNGTRRRKCRTMVCLLLLAASAAGIAVGVDVAIRCGTQGCLDDAEKESTSSAFLSNTEVPTTAPTFQALTTSPASQAPTASPISQAPTTAPTIDPTSAPTIAPTTQEPTTNAPTFGVLDGLSYNTLEALKDPSSPQSLAYAWIQNDPFLHLYSNERLLQRFALVTLYYATGGASWSESSGWLSHEQDECTWFSKVPEHGYPCDQDLQYRFLTLHGNGLNGTIPAEIFLLSSLNIFDLSTNNLHGSVPTEVGTLGKLQLLSLVQSGLTGSIPTELGMLTYMKQLLLNTNQFSGTLPTNLGLLSNLSKLIIFETAITGAIPTELGFLHSIEDLFLFKNSLSGPIPSELGHLNNMMSLNLEENRLTSTIPEVLGSLESLEQLFLRENDLEGSIEGLVFDSRSLVVLSMEENSRLTGTLPNAFCQLDALGFTCSDRLCGCWCECQTSG